MRSEGEKYEVLKVQSVLKRVYEGRESCPISERSVSRSVVFVAVVYGYSDLNLSMWFSFEWMGMLILNLRRARQNLVH